MQQLLQGARRHVLQAETSCYLFWGDAWGNRVDEVARRPPANFWRGPGK